MKETNEREILLVYTKKKGQCLRYGVDKKGILELRRYRNKKFRVLLNIFPKNNPPHELAALFNQNLIDQKNLTQQVATTQYQSQTKTVDSSYLSISTKTKQLSENRLIVSLNAYIDKNQPPMLVILGYLISSLVLYHNWSAQFSQESQLTHLLSELGKLLGRTHIDELNQNIKFKTGYEKWPYFLCLIGRKSKEEKIGKQLKEEDKLPIDYQNYLNEFYRFQSEKQHSKINSALQTLIDYFPQRSSLGVQVQIDKEQITFTQQGLRQVQQLGKQFEQKLVGRQLFSFQFTGTTIESLLFQLCQCFNTSEEINLTDIYNKVILNKKSRIETEMIQLYLAMVQKSIFLNNRIDLDDASFGSNIQTTSILPISHLQLNSITANIKQSVLTEMQAEALNCMNLPEYLNAKQNITLRISSYEQKLQQLNAELGNKFLNQCYSIVDIDQEDIKISWSQSNSLDMVREIFDLLSNKLGSFSYQCTALFAESDTNASNYNQTFLKLITNYLSKIQTLFSSTIQEFQLSKRKDKLQIETLNYELKRLLAQKQTVEKQYQLQLLIEAELKSKLKECLLEESSFSSSFSSESFNKKNESSTLRRMESSNFYNSSKEFYKMKKLIEELDEEVKDKNNQIQELTEILEKFESTSKSTNALTFYDKKTDKFNESTQKLIAEANSKILKFYEILEEVKQVEKHYETVKKSLMKEREKVIQEKRQSLKEVASLKDKAQKCLMQNEKLNEIIIEEKKALEKFSQLKETLKSNISHLEAENAETTCALAQVEGELEFYRKALTLVVEQYMKGKSQNLLKFYKFLEHPKLKELLKPLVGKH